MCVCMLQLSYDRCGELNIRLYVVGVIKVHFCNPISPRRLLCLGWARREEEEDEEGRGGEGRGV